VPHGGARIESIAAKLQRKVEVEKDGHLVVMVGTNNLKTEGSEDIMEHYKDLIVKMRMIECKRRSLVGILTRRDEDDYLEAKRLSINARLEKLCKQQNIEFVEPYDIYKEIGGEREFMRVQWRVLDRWGLHLNDWGQDQIARVIFKHCVRDLN
jgi:lysophospholipase L1-like esterase